MTDQGSVNSQILDSVADTVTIATGLAPSQAFGMLDTVMIETLGMAMYNAVSRQQGGSMVGSAAVTAACAKMLGTSVSVSPRPPVPPSIQPLPTPPIPPAPWNPPVPPAPPVIDPAAIIQQQTAAAINAIKIIHAQGETAATDEVLANKGLRSIATTATHAELPPAPPTPPPPPPPAPSPPAAASVSRRTPRPRTRS